MPRSRSGATAREYDRSGATNTPQRTRFATAMLPQGNYTPDSRRREAASAKHQTPQHRMATRGSRVRLKEWWYLRVYHTGDTSRPGHLTFRRSINNSPVPAPATRVFPTRNLVDSRRETRLVKLWFANNPSESNTRMLTEILLEIRPCYEQETHMLRAR